jgi:hypothetical protein
MNTAVRSMSLNPAPRASTVEKSAARNWFARVGATVWQAFEASGHARARRHILDFADQCEALQPDLAKELRAISNRSAQD